MNVPPCSGQVKLDTFLKDSCSYRTGHEENNFKEGIVSRRNRTV